MGKKPGETGEVKPQLGRPKKTTADLRPDWKELILKEMAEGASIEEIQAMLDTSNDLWYRLMKEDPIFSDTVNKGRRLCKAWWLGIGRKELWSSKTFIQGLWFMNMKNRFGWADKQKTDITTNGKALPAPILGGITREPEEK